MPALSSAAYSVRQDVCGGDHICYICQSDDEKWRVLCQFYQKGIERNEKMMFFQHSTPEEEVLSRLENGGLITIRECAAKGQFTVRYYADVYMTDGKFAPENMVSRLNQFTAECVAEGYSALRICGDMSWVNKEQDLTNKLIQYESMLNTGFPENYAALCMYDVRAFNPGDMLQVLATHPQAIINEKLLQNIYYMPPEEYLGADVNRSMLNRWMHNIEERKSVEEELITARNEAERAVHAKANFLATMSHEIRNPTNGIIGSADMLSQTHVSPEQSEFVNIIQASAKHLYRVVSDVLDFSKIESGKLELTEGLLGVKDLLEDSRRLCQYSIQKNCAVSLRCFTHPDCPENIVGDETRLRQILVNLIGNACKFTEEGEVVVSVMPVTQGEEGDTEEEKEEGDHKEEEKEEEEKEEEKEEEGDIEYKRERKGGRNVMFLEFSVSDSGKGISEEDLCKLFTQFTQIDVTQKWVGTGLGLAICKQLVEAMGGKILVKSVTGKGSTFSFRVPTFPLQSSPCVSPVPTPPLSPSLVTVPSFPSATSTPSISVPILPRPSLPSLSISLPLTSFSPPTTPKSLFSPLSSSSPSHPFLPDFPVTQAYDFSDDNVLVVEDDVTNQKVLCHMLRKLKCKVTIAANGLEAINLVKQNDYSLILTDQHMPECDGFAAMTQIRAYFAHTAPSFAPADAPMIVPEAACAPAFAPAFAPAAASARRCPTIVVCTGTYEGRLTEVMDDILIKPVRFKTISEILSRYCKNKAA